MDKLPLIGCQGRYCYSLTAHELPLCCCSSGVAAGTTAQKAKMVVAASTVQPAKLPCTPQMRRTQLPSEVQHAAHLARCLSIILASLDHQWLLGEHASSWDAVHGLPSLPHSELSQMMSWPAGAATPGVQSQCGRLLRLLRRQQGAAMESPAKAAMILTEQVYFWAPWVCTNHVQLDSRQGNFLRRTCCSDGLCRRLLLRAISLHAGGQV